MKTIEKAKAYDEALEDMRVIYPNLKGDVKLAVEHAFPQLRESEDERIREALIEEFTNQEHVISWWGGVKIKDILAYLKKQKEVQLGDKDRYMEGYMNGMNDALKEQKPLSPEDKVKHPLYVEGFEAGKEVGRQYEKVFGEQKPADKDFPPLEGVDAIKAKYYDKGFKNGFDEGVDSVKPAEWSEEDEDAVRHICRYLGYHCNEATARGCKKWLNVRLKSLRPQPKQEWSEEDIEAFVKSYSDSLPMCGEFQSYHDALVHAYRQGVVNTLEFLRPSWKPSEKQMAVLLNAEGLMRANDYKENAKILVEVIEELKKL